MSENESSDDGPDDMFANGNEKGFDAQSTPQHLRQLDTNMNGANPQQHQSYTKSRLEITIDTRERNGSDSINKHHRSLSHHSLMKEDEVDEGKVGYQYALSRTTSHDRPQAMRSPQFLTTEDINIIQRLDEEYEDALLEREISWNARYLTVRQNAGLSSWIMVLFLTIGTIFFQFKTDWTFTESLLFTVYTVTTVGYGNHEVPNDPSVLLFVSVYIFLGVAILTVMAAQLYQWVVLEITWMRYQREKQEQQGKINQKKKNSQDLETANSDFPGINHDVMSEDLEEGAKIRVKNEVGSNILESFVKFIDIVQAFMKENTYGQLIAVLIPFFFLILLGAAVVGGIQGWTFIESLYFSVASLTTVGFGDYYPDKLVSMWFCIIWLPFSVLFVSLYLGSVASFYIKVSNQNIARIERRLRKRMLRVREIRDKEREEARTRGESSGFHVDVVEDSDIIHLTSPQGVLPSTEDIQRADTKESDVYLTPKHNKEQRREDVLLNSASGQQRDGSNRNPSSHIETMKSVRDVILAIKTNMSTARRPYSDNPSFTATIGTSIEGNSHLLNIESTQHYYTDDGVAKKPTFALRMLVLERLAHIIANDIAGYQSNVEIKRNTLQVTIDSLKHTSQKWFIPKRATKTFRSVAFEALYFVGERHLIVRGADAIFDLTPGEVQGLFGPVLAGMGDADTMTDWLQRTQNLAESEIYNEDDDSEVYHMKMNLIDDRRQHQLGENVTANPDTERFVIGNAISKKRDDLI